MDVGAPALPSKQEWERLGVRPTGEVEAGHQSRVIEAERLIAVRIDALRHWLDDLSTAPIGIRTSSTSWQATLRAFVARHTRT